MVTTFIGKFLLIYRGKINTNHVNYVLVYFFFFQAWFSGHFHLGQDYQDSITFPTIDPKDGPYPNRGSCVFAQTSVMRAGTSRDGRQQSRLIRGNKDGFEICTVDHQKDGKIRVDATISYVGDTNEVGVYAHEDEAYEHDKYFKVYQPCAGDKLHPPDDGFRRYDADGNIPRELKQTIIYWGGGLFSFSLPTFSHSLYKTLFFISI